MNSEVAWVDRSPHRSTFLDVKGVELNYLDWDGNGPALLFLTGLGDSAHSFDDIAPAFTSRFRVLGLTRRGQGRSQKPRTGYELDELVDDVRQFLDSLGIQRAILAGWSLAGIEMTRFAVKYPGRVTSLVYLDAAYDFTGLPAVLEGSPIVEIMRPSSQDLESLDDFRSWMQSAWAKGLAWSEAMEAQLRDIVEIQADGSVRYAMRDDIETALFASAFSYNPEFDRVAVPVLSFNAFWPAWAYVDENAEEEAKQRVGRWLSDKLHPWQRLSLQRLRKEMPNAHIIEMPDTHHWCFEHKKQRVIDEMERFLTAEC